MFVARHRVVYRAGSVLPAKNVVYLSIKHCILHLFMPVPRLPCSTPGFYDLYFPRYVLSFQKGRAGVWAWCILHKKPLYLSFWHDCWQFDTMPFLQTSCRMSVSHVFSFHYVPNIEHRVIALSLVYPCSCYPGNRLVWNVFSLPYVLDIDIMS